MTTEPALIDLWTARDARYATSRHKLDDDAIRAVRWWRIREAGDDPIRVMEAARWYPPERRR
jgi:hypothetical protein